VFVASGLGLGAFWRSRRHAKLAALPDGDPSDEGPDPAEELRAKLARSNLAEGEVPAGLEAAGEIAGAESAGAQSAGAESSPLDPQSRRADLHERARASIDELR